MFREHLRISDIVPQDHTEAPLFLNHFDTGRKTSVNVILIGPSRLIGLAPPANVVIRLPVDIK